MKEIIVAMDGPSGTGKGTIASHAAKDLGFYYLDTGLFYRAITYLYLKNNLNENEYDKLLDLASNMDLEFKDYDTYLNGEDVSFQLRDKDVTSNVSRISSILEVRTLVNKLIRDYAEGKSIIIDGRDIGTVVFPDADVKIYLDASVDTRARRRFNQNIEMGIESNFEEILKSIQERDYMDKNKKYGALKVADDAVVVDTTNISIEETLEKIKKIIEGE